MIEFGTAGFVTIRDNMEEPDQQRKLSFRLNGVNGKTMYFEIREADDLRGDALALLNINIDADEFIAGLMHTFEEQGKRTL